MNTSLLRRIAICLAVWVAACIALPVCAADRKVKRRVAPIYPELAKRMHIGGMVRLTATVAPDGTVTDARTISGNKMLAPAAEDAIRRWKFAPGDSSSTESIDINFEAND
jgi:TonB family protein